MLKLKKWQFLKVALLSAFAVAGLSFNHVGVGEASSMADTVGSSSNAAQCQAVCVTGLPSKKQNGLLQVERDDEAPDPAAYVAAPVVLALIALTFVVKVLSSLSSWRPPDIIGLSGQRLFYA
jgi:hypothetical protein